MVDCGLKNVVGLFGTCGDSRWREETVIPILKEVDIEFFNPVVPDWDITARQREVENALSYRVIMLVITGQTTGFSSLAESGWIALNASPSGQSVIIVIEDMPQDSEPQNDDKGGRLSPNKTRQLLRRYIKEISRKTDGIYLCHDIVSAAHKAVEIMQKGEKSDE